MLEDIGLAVRDLEKADSLTRDPDLKAHVESELKELRGVRDSLFVSGGTA